MKTIYILYIHAAILSSKFGCFDTQKNKKIFGKGIAILKKNDIIDKTGKYGGIAQLVRVLA